MSGVNYSSSIPKIARSNELPLSYNQIMKAGLPQGNNLSIFLRRPGIPNIAAIRMTVEEIARRHEILRTRYKTVFTETQWSVTQVIDQDPLIEISLVDLYQNLVPNPLIAFNRLASRFVDAPFDLATTHPLRIKVIRMGKFEYTVIIAIHHIAFDAWSRAVLIREFDLHLAGFLSNQQISLPALPIQYADYAAWQRQYPRNDNIQSQFEYWREELAGFGPVFQMPTDRPRLVNRTYRRVHQQGDLLIGRDAELFDAMCAKQKVSPLVGILAAVTAYLYGYTAIERVYYHFMTAGRMLPETRRLIGFFAQRTYMANDLSDDPSFEELLQRIRVKIENLRHQGDVPYDLVSNEAFHQVDSDYAAQTQVIVTWFPLLGQARKKAKAAIRQDDYSHVYDDSVVRSASYGFINDLVIDITEITSGYEIAIGSNADLFDNDRIARIINGLRSLLVAAVNKPSVKLSKLPILSESERAQVASKSQLVPKLPESDVVMHRLFENQVRNTPLGLAVEMETVQLTYLELDRLASKLASWLVTRGGNKGSRIGVYLNSTVDLVWAIIGISKAGYVCVPLTPGLSSEQMRHIASSGRLSAIVSDPGIVQDLAEVGVEVVTTAFVAELDSSLAESVSTMVSSDEAYVIYDFDDRGDPLCKPISNSVFHSGLASMVEEIPLSTDDRVLHLKAIDNALSLETLFWPLVQGASLILPNQFPNLRGYEVIRLANQHRASAIHLSQSLLQSVILECEPSDLQEVEHITYVGRFLSIALQNRLFTIVPTALHVFHQSGGVAGSLLHRIYKEPTISNTVFAGPIANDVHIRILDRFGRTVPFGVPGLLHVQHAGIGIVPGSSSSPVSTSSNFEGSSVAHLKPTGDIAQLELDGNVSILGKDTNRVTLRGYACQLEEFEMVLRQHPAVLEAAVVVDRVEDNDPRITAYVFPIVKTDVTVKSLREFLAHRLSKYWLPFELVAVDQEPRIDEHGRVDVGSFASRDMTATMIENLIDPPGTTEKVLTKMLSHLLSLEYVARTNSLFDLGGSTGTARELKKWIRNVFNVDLTLHTIVLNPTPVALAALIDEQNNQNYQGHQVDHG